MAINYSKNEINKALEIFLGKYYPKIENIILQRILIFLFTKIFLIKWSIFNYKQALLQNFIKYRNSSIQKFELNKKVDFTKNYHELNNKGYTFVRDFFEKDSYEILLKSFPNFINFKHINKITKNYFTCYHYDNKTDFKEIKNIKYNNEFGSFIEHLGSQKFISDLEDLLFKQKENYKLNNFLCTYKKEGSYLIPHMDSIFDQTKENSYNFIYFIDGNDEFPEFSAGTGIYADNEFKEPLVLPDTLKNSCLIFKASNTNKFFHGFERVKAGGFAKVCTFFYVSKNIN